MTVKNTGPYERIELVKVNTIHESRYAVMIEAVIDGELRRSVVPSELVVDGNIGRRDFDAGEYGDDWASMIQVHVTPQVIAQALRRRGFWTVDDLAKRPGDIMGALQEAYGVDLGYLLQAARASRKTG